MAEQDRHMVLQGIAADLNAVLSAVPNAIGVAIDGTSNSHQHLTPGWWKRQQERPRGINKTAVLEEKLDPPMDPVIQPKLISQGPVKDASQVTKPLPTAVDIISERRMHRELGIPDVGIRPKRNFHTYGG